jgi:hypothetical protein
VLVRCGLGCLEVGCHCYWVPDARESGFIFDDAFWLCQGQAKLPCVDFEPWFCGAVEGNVTVNRWQFPGVTILEHYHLVLKRLLHGHPLQMILYLCWYGAGDLVPRLS